jgi:M6 family metalloprotease-like protein
MLESLSVRCRRAAPLALAAAALLSLHAAAAQDVVRAGSRYGIALPARALARVEADSTAFEFHRAWRQKTARVRAARIALERRQGLRLSITQLRAAAAAVTGTLRVPVLLGTYAATTPAYPASSYQTRLFGPGGEGMYSAKTYYQEISRNAFSLDGTAFGWLQLPQTAAYYDPPSSSDPFGRTGEFLHDALAAGDPGIDFGQFDNDGPDGIPNSGDDDGYVDVATFVYPEAGKACGGPGIWPHRWVYSGWTGAPYSTNDAAHNGGTIKVDDYLILGGIACDKASLMRIGTFTHEMGHGIGLPDLYDTDPDDGGGEGLGEWDLMASGNYLGGEAFPAHMSAWSKDYLGWLNVETVASSRPGYTLPTVYGGTVLRYDVPGTREYFLLEHREATAADAAIRGTGMLAYHVDPAVIDSTIGENRVNAHARQGVALVQADGLAELEGSVNRGDAGDPFPGTSGRTAFGFTTAPASRSNDGQASGLELQGISLSGSVLRFDLSVAPVLVAQGSLALSVPYLQSTSYTLHVGVTSPAPVALQAVSSVPWLTVSAPAGGAPGDVVVTANAAGLRAGERHTGTITLGAPGTLNSPLAVSVAMTVQQPTLAAVDSMHGSLTRRTEADTMRIALTAGDVVDVGMYAESNVVPIRPVVAIIGPDNVTADLNYRRTEPDRGFLLGYRAPVTGTYRLVVSALSYNEFGAVPFPYAVRVRRAGAYLDVADAGPKRLFGTAGAPAASSVRVRVVNRGAAAGTLWAGSDSSSVAVGLAGAAGAVVNAAPGTSIAPGDSLFITLAGAPGSRGPGYYTANPLYHLGADAFNGDRADTVYLRLADPRATVLGTLPERNYRDMAISPDGTVVVAAETALLKLDTLTGAATPWTTAAISPGQIQFGPDSLLYAVDLAGDRIVRFERDGSLTTLTAHVGFARGMALVPDGSIYFLSDAWLRHRRPDGTVEGVVYVGTISSFFGHLAYKDGWLYYTAGGELRRVNPASGVIETVAVLPGSAPDLLSLGVGAGGRLYGTVPVSTGGVLVMDGDGHLVDTLWGPGMSGVFALGDHVAYGVGDPGTTESRVFWRMPVNDAPRPLAGLLIGDPSGDGTITSLDALAVLTYVVGKQLPDGWTMGRSGDANCDGKITAVDALLILSQVVGGDTHAYCVGGRW